MELYNTYPVNAKKINEKIIIKIAKSSIRASFHDNWLAWHLILLSYL